MINLYLFVTFVFCLFFLIKIKKIEIERTKKENKEYKILINNNNNKSGYIVQGRNFLKITIEDKKYYTKKSCKNCSSKEVDKKGFCANCGTSRM